jgi:glycerophosphoryl diester phosphodiesterase
MPLGSRAALRLPKKGVLWGSLGALLLAVVIAVVLIDTLQIEDATEITAHRGYSAVAPENTIAAVERAIAAGADWAEIDVQETADGVVVLFHDRDLKKVAGLDWRIGETRYARLKTVDIGSRFSPEFADQRIATLAEVLELCEGKIRVNIELKYYGHEKRLEESVIQIVESKAMQSEVVLMSLKPDGVDKLKTLRPDWSVGLLTTVALGDLTRLDVDFLAVNTSLATGPFIRAAHRRGKAVHVWTVNDAIAMSALVSRGVDNIITDEPEMARLVLEQRAGLNPVERLLVRVGAALGVLRTEAGPSTDADA